MASPETVSDWRDGGRWRWPEGLLWLLAFALPALWPGHALIVNEIAIVALFAVSLDLVLGYTGIVTLGHAAFLGFGAYCAALFAKHIHPDPVLGLAVGMGAATLLGVADVAGKYYVPKLGAFIVYALMIALLMWRPQGLFVRKGAR